MQKETKKIEHTPRNPAGCNDVGPTQRRKGYAAKMKAGELWPGEEVTYYGSLNSEFSETLRRVLR